MKNSDVIFESENKKYRILEVLDEHFDMENLKGDTYNPKINTDIDTDELANQEKEFEEEVYSNGVFGYVLEKWNPLPGIGWEHVDSCWGFVGRYDENDAKCNHYIVEELKGQTK